MIMGPKWIAALGALALAGGSSGVAVAGPTIKHPGLGTYVVRVSVPTTPVREGSTLGADITAHGDSPNRAQLEVFASKVKCEHSAGLEKSKGSHLIINEKVVGRFSHAVKYVTVKGTWFACAYLYKIGAPNDTLARAEASWQVVKK
jgi:hypothetical protein